jgi:hypothetical protein
MKYLAASVLLFLVGCSFGIREDFDQIGSIRKSYDLGWKPQPQEQYRPYRQQQNNYYQGPPQQQSMYQEGCAPVPGEMAQASPKEAWNPQPWVK